MNAVFVIGKDKKEKSHLFREIFYYFLYRGKRYKKKVIALHF